MEDIEFLGGVYEVRGDKVYADFSFRVTRKLNRCVWITGVCYTLAPFICCNFPTGIYRFAGLVELLDVPGLGPKPVEAYIDRKRYALKRGHVDLPSGVGELGHFVRIIYPKVVHDTHFPICVNFGIVWGSENYLVFYVDGREVKRIKCKGYRMCVWLDAPPRKHVVEAVHYIERGGKTSVYGRCKVTVEVRALGVPIYKPSQLQLEKPVTLKAILTSIIGLGSVVALTHLIHRKKYS